MTKVRISLNFMHPAKKDTITNIDQKDCMDSQKQAQAVA